jgi:uncharacterized repeat protein (TIGR03803 family)
VRSLFEEDIPMKKRLLTLTDVLAFASLTFTLAVCAQAQTVTVLANFDGQIAFVPVTPVEATDGNFYGVVTGGILDDGLIYRMTPAGSLSSVHRFCSEKPLCADGKDVFVNPILGSDGNLYGVTAYGGSADTGVIYRVSPDGDFAVIYNICPTNTCPDGTNGSWLTEGSDGNFYGATADGGSHNDGDVFRVSPSGEFRVLHNFCSQTDCADGGIASSPPIEGIDGNFYGVARGGGSLQGGVMYKVTPSGTYSVVHNFCNYTDDNCSGAQPLSITQNASGNFFGVSTFAGAHGVGSLFEFTSTQQYKVLHSFDLISGTPLPGLTLASDGNIYGRAVGSRANGGTIFSVSPSGVYTRVYSLSNDCVVGCVPYYGPLFQGTDGRFYAATTEGGSDNDGTIIGLDNGLGPIVKTAPTVGKPGRSVLILGNGLTGTSSVTFNGVPATFTVESDTYIKATVPAGATTGTVSVVTPTGTLSSPQFLVTK